MATIIFHEKPYQLQPTFQALSTLENELGLTVTSMAIKLAEGQLNLDALASIIEACIEPKIEVSQIKEGFLSHGFSHVTYSLARMFAELFSEWQAKGMAVKRVALEELQTQFPD